MSLWAYRESLKEEYIKDASIPENITESILFV